MLLKALVVRDTGVPVLVLRDVLYDHYYQYFAILFNVTLLFIMNISIKGYF